MKQEDNLTGSWISLIPDLERTNTYFIWKTHWDTFKIILKTSFLAVRLQRWKNFSYFLSFLSKLGFAKFNPTAFFVDEVLTWALSEQEAKYIQTRLISTLEKGQSDLRKWTCSEPQVTLSLPPEYKEANEDFEFPKDTHTNKTFGIVWNPKFDVFHFKMKQINGTMSAKALSKRQILSDTAKIFDPLGWLSPTSINLKSLLQKIWVAKLDSDYNLPNGLAKNFLEWRWKLIDLRETNLSRFVLKEKQTDLIAMHVSVTYPSLIMVLVSL